MSQLAARGWPHSEIESRRQAVKGGRQHRRHHYRPPRVSWTSPDTVAAMHGAVIGYAWKGGWTPRLDWDAVTAAAQFLLGYQWRALHHTSPPLKRALQHVILGWPPPPSVRHALHAVIDTWARDPALNTDRFAPAATRRLQRARSILESWNP